MAFETILFPIAFGAVFVGIIAVAHHFEKKKMKQVGGLYQQLASKFKLNYIPEKKGFLWNYTYPKVSGDLSGNQIHLHSYKTGGKNKTTYTDLSVVHPAKPIKFRIVKENFFNKIGKAFGAQDIIIGNEELDKVYVFKCDDEQLMRELIDEEISAMLLHLNKDIHFSLQNKGNKFNYNFVGHMDNDKKLETLEKILVVMLKISEKLPKT